MITLTKGDLVLSIRGSRKGQTGVVTDEKLYRPPGFVRVRFDNTKSSTLKQMKNLVPEHLAMDEGL